MKKTLLLFISIMPIILLSCQKNKNTDNNGLKNTGCSNPNATNYDPQVNGIHQDQCQYSTVTFFYLKDTATVRHDTISRPIDSVKLPITLYINGQLKGTLTTGLMFAPQNCDATLPNTLHYNFLDDAAATWVAISKDSQYVYSGTIQPRSTQPCIQVPIR